MHLYLLILCHIVAGPDTCGPLILDHIILSYGLEMSVIVLHCGIAVSLACCGCTGAAG